MVLNISNVLSCWRLIQIYLNISKLSVNGLKLPIHQGSINNKYPPDIDWLDGNHFTNDILQSPISDSLAISEIYVATDINEEDYIIEN